MGTSFHRYTRHWRFCFLVALPLVWDLLLCAKDLFVEAKAPEPIDHGKANTIRSARGISRQRRSHQRACAPLYGLRAHRRFWCPAQKDFRRTVVRRCQKVTLKSFLYVRWSSPNSNVLIVRSYATDLREPGDGQRREVEKYEHTARAAARADEPRRIWSRC